MLLTPLSSIETDLQGLLEVKLNDEILITSEIVENYLFKRYSDYSFVGFDFNDFLVDWNSYNFLKVNDLKRMLDAYNSDYNPIHNYDRKEVVSVEYGEREKTNTYGKKVETVENSVVPFDTESFSNTEKIETNNDSHIDNYFEETATDTTTNNTSGNIGITTTQMMIESELSLRTRIIVYDYLKEFVKNFLYYIK